MSFKPGDIIELAIDPVEPEKSGYQETTEY